MNNDNNLVLQVFFFATDSGSEPVRDWLRGLDREDMRTIGEEIMVVQYEWPLGMPLVRKMAGARDLWEVRVNLTVKRIARVLFTIQDSNMILLHGFIKKSKTTPKQDIKTAVDRKSKLNKKR